MDILKWNELLIKHPQACTKLYYWITKKNEIEDYRVQRETFIKLLQEKNIAGNEEKLFVFFDENIIFCGVYPVAIKTYVCFTQSEYRAYICNDMPSRELCTERIVSNGLDLLEERIKEQNLLVLKDQNKAFAKDLTSKNQHLKK